VESCRYVLSLYSVHLFWGVLVDEIFNEHETTSNSNKNLVSFVNLYIYSFLSKLVDSFRFSYEKNLHFRSFWVFVKELAKIFVDFVFFLWDINCLIFCCFSGNVWKLCDLLLGLVELEIKILNLIICIFISFFYFIKLINKFTNLIILVLL